MFWVRCVSICIDKFTMLNIEGAISHIFDFFSAWDIPGLFCSCHIAGPGGGQRHWELASDNACTGIPIIIFSDPQS